MRRRSRRLMSRLLRRDDAGAPAMPRKRCVTGHASVCALPARVFLRDACVAALMLSDARDAVDALNYQRLSSGAPLPSRGATLPH